MGSVDTESYAALERRVAELERREREREAAAQRPTEFGARMTTVLSALLERVRTPGVDLPSLGIEIPPR